MIKRLDLYLNTPATGVIHAADVVLDESEGMLVQVGFRYRPAYLQAPGAFPIDPVMLPLTAEDRVLSCKGGMPAFLDDYLPDDWGRRVLAKLALYRDRRRINASSAIDTLSLLSHSRIGAVCLVDRGAPPHYEYGHPVSALQAAEQAAQQIDRVDFKAIDIDEMSLLYLANAGTGVGGARPKALLYDDAKPWLAKFNRITRDDYNNARVELACLDMAKAAGLDVRTGKIVPAMGGREVLLLERFDIEGASRRHLITVNGLLKQPSTQQDYLGAFRYDDIYELLQKFSCRIQEDIRSLLRLMLFNRAINNTDDHERNFSFIYGEEGYGLAPAYDLVPSLSLGQYHAAGYQYQPAPPLPSQAEKLGHIFALPKEDVRDIAAQVRSAVLRWEEFAEGRKVTGDDIQAVKSVMRV